MTRTLGPLIVAIALAAGVAFGESDSPTLLTGIANADALVRAIDERLAHARSDVAALVEGHRPALAALESFDHAQLDIETADTLSTFIPRMSADASIRTAAQQAAPRVSELSNATWLDRRIYDALAGIGPAGLDDDARYFLSKTVATYRLAGVSLDGDARARVASLRTKIDALNRSFTANIESGTRSFRVERSRLSGLPDDFIRRHPAKDDGTVELTSAAADAIPTLSSATDGALRREMFVAVNNVGYPANQQVLADLRQTRTELAHLLGYRSWADYDVADHMAGTVQRVESFLSTIDEGTKKPAEAEYQQLLKRKQQDVPAATSLDAWEADYYTELVRQESTPAGEPFRLPYAAAEAGILRVAGRLFGLSLEPVTVLVWDPSVKTLVIRRNGVTLGVVYLDMYVRPNKRNRGAGTVMLRSGNGQQLPEVALIAGFGGDASTQSSLTHAELRTFFHELGHVIHFVVGGRHRWSGLDSIHAERDFLEAPSQMLESWMWDPATIALLMGGSERPAGGPRLDLSRAQQTAQFGEGLRERNLLFRSRLALQLHVGDPATSADEVTQTTYERSLPFRIVPDTHHWAGFTHLANPNYTSSYYTYLWSLAVARDLESTFDHADLLATAPAERYRRMIVEVGASQPASQMLERFLGRPFSATAWLESLHPPR